MKLSRVHGAGYREAIGFALGLLPVPIADRLSHVQFVCGVDPVFAGLHDTATTDDGRSYGLTAHCAYGWGLPRPASDRVTTIVLPIVPLPSTVVHELGHALHETLGFDPEAEPVTEYAKTNRWEAFAEAFVAWRFWGYGDEPDDRTVWLLDAMAAGREVPAVRL